MALVNCVAGSPRASVKALSVGKVSQHFEKSPNRPRPVIELVFLGFPLGVVLDFLSQISIDTATKFHVLILALLPEFFGHKREPSSVRQDSIVVPDPDSWRRPSCQESQDAATVPALRQKNEVCRNFPSVARSRLSVNSLMCRIGKRTGMIARDASVRIMMHQIGFKNLV
jgi:hypothetical protein